MSDDGAVMSAYLEHIHIINTLIHHTPSVDSLGCTLTTSSVIVAYLGCTLIPPSVLC